MFSPHPLKQILKDTIADWDHDGIPQNVRENFWKIINCGTPALGAEVLASSTEWKIVYHTCKSRFCPSCGARAAALWQEELEAALPNIPYIEINFTMPKVFWAILQQNPSLLPDLPALGAAAIKMTKAVRALLARFRFEIDFYFSYISRDTKTPAGYCSKIQKRFKKLSCQASTPSPMTRWPSMRRASD